MLVLRNMAGTFLKVGDCSGEIEDAEFAREDLRGVSGLGKDSFTAAGDGEEVCTGNIYSAFELEDGSSCVGDMGG